MAAAQNFGIPSTIFLIPILFLFVIMNADGWRPFKVSMINVTTATFSTSVRANTSLSTTGAITVFVHILNNINYPYVNAEVYADSGNGQFDFEVLNRTVDVCEFFRNPQYEPLLQIIYKMLLESGPWPRTCPIRKSQFSIENFIVNPDNLPPYLPERKGFVGIRFRTKENGVLNDLATLSIFFEIINTGINRLKGVTNRKY